MLDAICPTCGNQIRIKKESEAGQYVSCPNCQSMFTLVSVIPPMLKRLSMAWEIPQEKLGRRGKDSKTHHFEFEDDDEFEEFSHGKRSKRSEKRGRHYEME